MFATALSCRVNLSLLEMEAHHPHVGGAMETTGQTPAPKRKNAGKQSNVYAVDLTSIGSKPALSSTK